MSSTTVTVPSVEYYLSLDQAIRKLAALGTADKIADFLLAEGITGGRGDSKRCPLARWLQREVGYEHIRISYRIRAVFEDYADFSTSIPAPLAEFIENYDQKDLYGFLSGDGIL